MILKTNFKFYKLRQVDNKDLDLLYKWRNHRLIRSKMIDNNYIKYENHIKWFKQNKKLKMLNY